MEREKILVTDYTGSPVVRGVARKLSFDFHSVIVS